MPDVLGTGLLLSDAERDRFATWLEHEAKVAEGMIDQMKKINVVEAALVRERLYMLSCKVIAGHLRSTESMSIG